MWSWFSTSDSTAKHTITWQALRHTMATLWRGAVMWWRSRGCSARRSHFSMNCHMITLYNLCLFPTVFVYVNVQGSLLLSSPSSLTLHPLYLTSHTYYRHNTIASKAFKRGSNLNALDNDPFSLFLAEQQRVDVLQTVRVHGQVYLDFNALVRKLKICWQLMELLVRGRKARRSNSSSICRRLYSANENQLNPGISCKQSMLRRMEVRHIAEEDANKTQLENILIKV